MRPYLPTLLEGLGALLLILAAALFDLRLGIALGGGVLLLAAYALERNE